MAKNISLSPRSLARSAGRVALIALSTILAGILGLVGVLLFWSYPGRPRPFVDEKGAPLAVSSYYVARNGMTWHITFSSSRWLMEKDRQRTIDSVLASWRWQ